MSMMQEIGQDLIRLGLYVTVFVTVPALLLIIIILIKGRHR